MLRNRAARSSGGGSASIALPRRPATLPARAESAPHSSRYVTRRERSPSSGWPSSARRRLMMGISREIARILRTRRQSCRHSTPCITCTFACKPTSAHERTSRAMPLLVESSAGAVASVAGDTAAVSPPPAPEEAPAAGASATASRGAAAPAVAASTAATMVSANSMCCRACCSAGRSSAAHLHLGWSLSGGAGTRQKRCASAPSPSGLLCTASIARSLVAHTSKGRASSAHQMARTKWSFCRRGLPSAASGPAR
mmetsp:Transcript_19197/g.54558  ORF Transcript_19197/g.54558 Transcript_19197/m.54558 type:complete len:255 (-) Transcript_19197:119-883(-)